MTVEPTDPVASGSESTTVRNVLLGIIAGLIGVLLIAAGFLGRIITEPERRWCRRIVTARGHRRVPKRIS
jgi:hypothetical protein